MWILTASVFVAVFAGATLALWLLRGSRERQAKQALARLEVLTAETPVSQAESRPVVRPEEPFSSIPWLDRWLRRLDAFGRLRLLLQQAQLDWTPAGFLAGCAACWLALAAVLWLRSAGIVPSLLFGSAALLLPWIYVFRKRARHFEAFEQMLPEALDLIVAALRAGHGVTAAMGAVGKEMADPIGREFRQCFEEQNFGLDLRASLENLASRVPTQDVRMIVTAFLVQRESGGNLAEVLDRAAAIVRERFRLKRQVQVNTAQGRLTGWILGLLPPVLGVLLYLANPDNIRLLWTHPTGLKMLYTASVLMVIGILIIRKIVKVRL